MRRTLKTINATLKKYKNDDFSNCVPNTLSGNRTSPQWATTIYTRKTMEIITEASVISRIDEADMAKGRFDGLSKRHLWNIRQVEHFIPQSEHRSHKLTTKKLK